MFDSTFFQHSRVHWDFFSQVDSAFDSWRPIIDRYEQWLNSSNGVSTIPPQIHQIWIGGEVPNVYRDWQISWEQLLPDFSFHLWSEEELLDFGLENERAFRAAKNPAVKSDIARYEILFKVGGVYVDTDFECLKAIQPLLVGSSFVAGTGFSSIPQINNGFIAAEPESAVLAQMIASISGANVPTERHPSDFLEIFNTTGPNALTSAVLSRLESDSTVCVLPSNYLYPWPSFLRDRAEDRYSFSTEQTFAIHHWDVSWGMRSSLRVGIGEALRHSKKKRLRRV